MSAFEHRIEITNKKGLHARASAKFVSLAATLSAQITVTKDGSSVTGTSILGLMMLGAAKGDHITIAASGDAAEDALAQVVALVEGKFGED
jgi:phosphocarrier protein HPr